ncbi:MAG: hypothetical protein H0U95_02960 [Bacteroidetes bacterium]|nr:hypothetical protein [Bacteroidota bacterium]
MKKFLPYFLCLCILSSFGQTRKRNFRQREIGIFGGASYYIGDLNPRGHFSMSKPAAGIFFRYSTHYRYAFRFGFNYGNIAGNDAKSKELDQLERNISFKSPVYDLHAIAEFNFVDYRIGNEKHRFTMFIFAGIGAYHFNPQSSIASSSVPSSTNLHNGVVTKHYSRYQVNIPYGIGFKWHLTDIFGLGIEWSPRKLFTDYLDDVSSEYGDGSMRGNPRTKDWYFFYGMTLTMRLPNLNKPCFQNN